MKIIHVIKLNYENSNGIKSVLSNLVPNQNKLGHQVAIANVCKNKSSIFDSEFYTPNIIEFEKVVKTICPDIVVFHGAYELLFYIFAFRLKQHNYDYLFEPHGGLSKYNIKKKRILKAIVNTLLTKPFVKKSSGTIFLNIGEYNNSIFKGIIDNFGVVPNGVKINKIDVCQKLKSTKIKFIFLSRIDIKYKGLDILLKAIEKVSAEHSDMDFEFHFYGSRYDKKIVDQFEILLNNTKGPVHYHGEVLGKEKEKAYENANIYVLPSLSEGMPVTVLEALSYGNPCIITPQTNMVDIIEGNHAGWIAEPTTDSLKDVIYSAYNDYLVDGERYVNNAIKAAKLFEWKAIADHSIHEYARLIGKNDSIYINQYCDKSLYSGKRSDSYS